MTLTELVRRLRKPPKAGAHEVVLDKHDIGHLVIITRVVDIPAEAGGSVREFVFMSWCGALNSYRADDLEVAKAISCFMCIQWKR